MNTKEELIRARGRGAALIALTTQDSPAALKLVSEAFSGVPIVGWDACRGPYPLTQESRGACAEIVGQMDPTSLGDFPSFSLRILEVVEKLADLYPSGVIFAICNAHRLISAQDSLRVVQGIQNLRDPFTSLSFTLILLCPSWPGCPELGSDVLVIDDALPTEEERRAAVTQITGDAQVPVDSAAVERATRLTRGLSRYAVEQTVALSLEAEGLEEKALQSRFIAAINSTPGLRYEPPSFSMQDIGGLQNFKAFALAMAAGREPPDVVVRIEEVEKATSGASGAVADSSGTSQGILSSILTFMEEKNATGMISLGPPGSGKSMCSVALGSILGVPTITLDIGALKGSLVGQSEAQTRAALTIIESVGGARSYWIASCNSDAVLPPELKRRFTDETWFFDLPTAEEKEEIWNLYLKKYELEDVRPNDAGWTGAEIRNACRRAWRFRVTPREAARWMVSMARSSSVQIEALRSGAHGRYISASAEGVYQYPGPVGLETPPTPKTPPGRKFALK